MRWSWRKPPPAQDAIVLGPGSTVVAEHVVPVGDVHEHPASTDCLCGPRVEMVVVHHSLDGREAGE